MEATPPVVSISRPFVFSYNLLILCFFLPNNKFIIIIKKGYLSKILYFVVICCSMNIILVNELHFDDIKRYINLITWTHKKKINKCSFYKCIDYYILLSIYKHIYTIWITQNYLNICLHIFAIMLVIGPIETSLSYSPFTTTLESLSAITQQNPLSILKPRPNLYLQSSIAPQWLMLLVKTVIHMPITTCNKPSHPIGFSFLG